MGADHGIICGHSSSTNLNANWNYLTIYSKQMKLFRCAGRVACLGRTSMDPPDLDPATVADLNDFYDLHDLRDPTFVTLFEQGAAVVRHAFGTLPTLFQCDVARAFICVADEVQYCGLIGGVSGVPKSSAGQGNNERYQDYARRQAS